MSRYRFLGRPRWILFTALIAGLVVLMVNLAFWQLRRLHWKRDLNHQIVEREHQPVAPIGQLVGPGASAGDVAAEAWRTAEATGTYDRASEVLIRNRDFGGSAGYHVVTPLRLDDGSAVLVNRGWVPLETEVGAIPSVPPAPSGRLTVTGRVRPTQHKGRFFSPSDPPTGRLSQLYRVDVPRIGHQVPYPLIPAYLELLSTDPLPTGAQPEVVPAPELDEGPHLSYAAQWFFFSACAVVGWVLVVRRSARSRQRSVARGEAEEPTADEVTSRGLGQARTGP